MTNGIKSIKDIAMIVVRIPLELKRKIKIIAAYDNCSMSEKASSYIEKGIQKEEKKLMLFNKKP
jgi:hypothetical protein